MPAMSSVALPTQLNASLSRTRYRVRFSRFIRKALPIWSVLGGVICLAAIFEHAEWMEPVWMRNVQWLMVAGMIGVATWVLSRSVTVHQAAALLDAAAGGDTVIPAAVSFARHPQEGPFVEMTLSQADAHSRKVSPALAVPLLFPLAAMALPFFAITYVATPLVVKPPQLNWNLVDVPVLDNQLDITPNFAKEDPEFTVLKEEIQDLLRQTELFGNTRTKELARELKRIVDAVEKGLMQPSAAAAKAEEIAKALADGNDNDPTTKEMEAAFEELAKTLKKEKDFSDLAKAFEQKDFDSVKRELAKVEQQRAAKTPEEQKKMDAAMQKAMDEAANNLEAKAAQAQAKAKSLENQKKSGEAEDARKEAEKYRRAADTVRQMGKSPGEKAESLKKRIEEAEKSGDKQAAEALKKAMERMQKAQEQAQKAQQQGQQGQKQGQQQGQQQGQHQGEKQGQQQGEKQGQQQSTSQNMGDSVDNYMRNRSEQESQQKTSNTAEEVREAMKRLRQGGQCKGGNSGGRQSGVQDFFRRAGGQQPGEKPGQGQGGQKPGGQKPGGGQGSGIGSEDGGKLLGKSERTEVKTTDHQLDTKRQGDGPTRQQIILGASDKGFSKTQYKEVFTKYQEAAKEVLKDEKIPPGYKHLVKVYYRLIRPREGQ